MNANQFLFSKLSGHPVKYVLKLFYWKIFRRPHRDRLGVDTYIMPNFYCSDPRHILIGQRVLIGRYAHFEMLTCYLGQLFKPKLLIKDDVYIGSNCEIVCINYIEIGAGTVLSDNVYINESSHDLSPGSSLIMDRPLVTKGPIQIGSGCFIGRNVMIFSGVIIGDNCVVGAGSVVTSSIPNFTKVAGSPARIIQHFDPMHNELSVH